MSGIVPRIEHHGFHTTQRLSVFGKDSLPEYTTFSYSNWQNIATALNIFIPFDPGHPSMQMA